MRINNNLMAMNTHRQLGIANNMGARSMEKLSSGYRINRAGDDAAGLAISEKMRGQIRGLNQASRNAQDGISLIQTAEGALNETHSILQRMRELAVQAATDTNTGVDRQEIQKEINELIDEIDRIAKQTQFNEQNLLDGSFAGKRFHIGANEGQDISLSINAMTSGPVGGTAASTFDNQDVAVGGQTATVNGTFAGTTDVEVSMRWSGTVWEIDNGSGTYATWTTPVIVNGVTFTAPGDDGTGTTPVSVNLVAGTGGGTPVGPGLGIDGLKVDLDVDPVPTSGGVLSNSDASGAITTIQTAIETVSAERSKLGAYQNRLEHTINNLDNTSENLQAAESRIRDVDMAKEMMEFTKQNILQQAATAMLAQANQSPQGVLQLLR